MSSWFDERAQQRREDRVFDARLRRDERRMDREEEREIKAQKRRDKRERRRERAQAWAKNTTARALYSRGTVALVTASVLASLPAQVAHFAGISLMLITVPFALEGAAWVAAFGVMYADEKGLPAWVRWLLRAMCLSAAGYAAWINYGYGVQTAPAVGYGLAAVSLLGPLFFEVRQWVTTLTFDSAERKRRAEAKARVKHAKQRRKDHEDVVKLARRLVSAAPYGTLDFEKAFAAAWEIFYGTDTPCMTPALHAQQVASRRSLSVAMDEANGAPISVRGRLLTRLHPAPSALLSVPGSSQVANQIPPTSERPSSGQQKTPKNGPRFKPVPPVRRKGDTAPYHQAAKVAAADTARKHVAVNGHAH
ncbi:hypothetical protein [Streptomyces echinatus]|uniref:Uncharacterized protein n=1 Tax=Streptomyces echinatus TaxID=67293 RepID=A0A7W9Q2G0_9ACTN|nr:hypothetical protein [Streptomyces echinatus]MBB5932330.1 hypothetical protein [Streptomyces echinatus]